MTRQLERLRGLPPGKSLALSVSLWQLGDAFWLFVAGEHYQLLQRQLRGRFADTPIVVTTLTDGWLPGYVPTAETYGRGIYQESIAVVAPGSLERLIEALAAHRNLGGRLTAARLRAAALFDDFPGFGDNQKETRQDPSFDAKGI